MKTNGINQFHLKIGFEQLNCNEIDRQQQQKQQQQKFYGPYRTYLCPSNKLWRKKKYHHQKNTQTNTEIESKQNNTGI